VREDKRRGFRIVSWYVAALLRGLDSNPELWWLTRSIIPSFLFFSEARRRSAFRTIMGELGGAWLNLKRVDADWVADQLMATMDEYVLDQDHAMKALSKLQGEARYEGKEYLLIVSHDRVDAQHIHIDCVYPDYLGTMQLTPGPKTVLSPVHEELGIQMGAMTCHDFAKLVCSRMGGAGKDREEELSRELAKCADVTKLIQDCGYLLASLDAPVCARATERLLASNPGLADTQPGYIGMTGSTCRCIPASDHSRVVFSATYTKRGTDGCSTSTQHHVCSMLADVILSVAPDASQAAINALLILFSHAIASDPSLGSFLDGMHAPKEERKKWEALRRLRSIRSTFKPV
jgi:hypothetical protein